MKKILTFSLKKKRLISFYQEDIFIQISSMPSSLEMHWVKLCEIASSVSQEHLNNGNFIEFN